MRSARDAEGWRDGMDAGDIYRRLPGLTEGKAVALAVAYHLGKVDARGAGGRRTGPTRRWARRGARTSTRTAGRAGRALDAGTVARLIEWDAAGWDDGAAAGDR